MNKLSFFLGSVILFNANIALSQITTYPTKPIRMIVGFTPSGGADTIARLVGVSLAERLGQPVVVDNRPGAGGMIATTLVVNAVPDGHTILLANASYATNPVLYEKTVQYDPIKDLQAVIRLGSSQYLLTVNPGLGVGSVKELIAYAKARPKKLNMASAGLGGPGHLSGELFKMLTGTDMLHVPYKGTSPVVASLVGGETQLVFGNVGGMLPMIRAGKLKGLAVSGAQRSTIAPEFPTVAEAGVPGFEVSSWYGIFVPARVTKKIVNLLYKELEKTMETRELQEKIVKTGLEIMVMPPDEFSVYIRDELVKWRKVVKSAGIRLE